MNLEDDLRELVRDEVEAAVADALEGADLEAEHPGEETWQARVWRVPPETRLSLEQVSEALDCSTRQVRRYVNGESKAPRLEATKGPMGLTVRAGDLRDWIQDAERAERFREAS